MTEAIFDLSEGTPERLPSRRSPQQAEVIDWVENDGGNATVIAVAGSGKTTTLIDTVGSMRGKVVYGAFNKAIADDVEGKVSLLPGGTRAQVNVGTFHRFGYRALRTHSEGSPRLDAYKLNNIVRSRAVRQEMRDFAKSAVSIAKLTGVGAIDGLDIEDNEVWRAIVDHHALDSEFSGGPGNYRSEDAILEDVRDGIEFARDVLMESIETADECIDFDDQLYLPIYHDYPFQLHDWVLVDEAQDTNALRLEISQRMLRPGGRLIAVGDPAQAIYGFTGADSASLRHIAERFETIDLPLTVSWRCPKAVVRVAQQWNSLIEPSPTAPEGEYRVIDMGNAFIGEVMGMTEDERSRTTILCRYNAPIVSLAFRFLRDGISAHVQGRDIGGQVKNLLKKFERTTRMATDLIAKVEEFQRREEQRFLAKGQETRAASVVDKCQTLIAVARGAIDLDRDAKVYDVELWIDRILNDDFPGLTLSSIHKAKGREWDTVFWLGRNGYQPCKWVKRDWQMEQELNLMYVAATRARKTLVEVNVKSSSHREFDAGA